MVARRKNRTSHSVGRVPGALLLTPGAGADRTHHTLVAIEKAVKAWSKAGAATTAATTAQATPLRGMPASRVDFPYRKAGKAAPDKAPVAVAHLKSAAARLIARAGCAPHQLVLGGRSYGGRMCSLAVAEGLPAAGLILLSYPLHPPGKPDRLRVEHFADIAVPVLFVSGSRDPFGSPDEFAAHIGAIAGSVTQQWLSGGHDPKNQDDAIAGIVTEWLSSL